MAPPADPATLALLIVHEFQHVKLDAMLDLYDLFDSADTPALPGTWQRTEPRPLDELLQETYARLAVEPESGHTRDAIDALAHRPFPHAAGGALRQRNAPQRAQPSSSGSSRYAVIASQRSPARAPSDSI